MASVLVTGWVLPRFLGNLEYPVPALLQADHEVPVDERPSFRVSLFVPLIPAIIMVAATVANLWLTKGTVAYSWVNFFGSSLVAVSLAMVAAFYFFGVRTGRGLTWAMETFGGAVQAIAMVVLIIGAGGALKQMIIDTGIGGYIGSLMTGTSANPYLMAWLITVLIRLATGQGVVSAMTAAGIIGAAVVDPVTGMLPAGVNSALLVLATAAGSNTITHVNDAAFWLFKGYFDLSVKDTLKTWGMLELCNSVVGLAAVLVLSIFAS